MSTADERLKNRLDEMRRLLEAARDLAGELDLKQLLGQFARHAAAALDAEDAELRFTREAFAGLWGAAGLGETLVLTAEQETLLEPVLGGGEALTWYRSSAAAAEREVFDGAGRRPRNALVLPLAGGLGRVFGVLAVFDKREGRFNKHDRRLLGRLVEYGAVSLETAAMHHQSEELLRRQRRLLEVGRALSGERDLTSLLKLAARVTSEVMEAERTTVFLIDEERDELWSIVAEGLTERSLRIPREKGVAGYVATTGELVNIADAYADPRFNPEVDRETGYKTRNMLVMPMKRGDGRILGVVQVLNKQRGLFSFEDEEQLRMLAGFVGVAVANALMERENDRLLQRQRVLLEAGQAIGRIMPIGELLTILAKLATEILEADRSTVFILDREAGELWSMVAEGTEEIRFPADKGIAGAVAASGETLNIPEAYDDPRFNRNIDRQTGYRTKSILALPLRDKQGRVMGVFQVLNRRPPGGRLEESEAFTADDERLLSILAAQAAVSIENNLLYEQRRAMFLSFTETLSRAVDAKDKITGNHIQNVTRYTVMIGREMGLEGAGLESLRVAALLHDVGKIGVRDSILCKTGRFTPEEYEEMKRHVVISKQLLRRIKFERGLRDVPDVAGAHHEKLDGSGYPDGLAGDAIPLGARMMMVADIFDALTQRRHYKEPLPPDEAFSILRSQVEAGKLDGRCVEALYARWKREPFEIHQRDREYEELF